ncbi:MAG: ABC transporter permease, partial [Maritimibacter sp.]|nr:ABC transporter permease [Maritimibacter sp.]
ILLSGMPPEFNLVIKALIIIVILVIQSPTVKHSLYLLRAKASSTVSDGPGAPTTTSAQARETRS